MRRSPNPWPIGLREPNPAGVRETRAVAVMVGHSEEVGSGYANAGGERYLVISVAAQRCALFASRPSTVRRRKIGKRWATRLDRCESGSLSQILARFSDVPLSVMRTWRALALQEISERRSFRVKLRMPERFMPQEGAAQRMQISSAYRCR